GAKSAEPLLPKLASTMELTMNSQPKSRMPTIGRSSSRRAQREARRLVALLDIEKNFRSAALGILQGEGVQRRGLGCNPGSRRGRTRARRSTEMQLQAVQRGVEG